MVDILPIVIIGTVIVVAILWHRFFGRHRPGKRHITYEEMCRWNDEKILMVETEEIIDDKKKTWLFDVVNEHLNDKHNLRKLLSAREYAEYENEYRKLKASAPQRIYELYENLVRVTKASAQRKLSKAA